MWNERAMKHGAEHIPFVPCHAGRDARDALRSGVLDAGRAPERLTLPREGTMSSEKAAARLGPVLPISSDFGPLRARRTDAPTPRGAFKMRGLTISSSAASASESAATRG